MACHPRKNSYPQGSCLGSFLWFLIANIILSELEKYEYMLYGFSFIFSDKRRLDLELEAAQVLPVFCQLLECLHLILSINKFQALGFGKPPLPKRKPTIKIYCTSVRHVPNLKFLCISIDQHCNWFSRINQLILKLINFYHNSLKLITKSCGIKNSYAQNLVFNHC